MRHLSPMLVAALFLTPSLLCADDDLTVTAIRVDPPTVELLGPDARYQLLVDGELPNGRTIDLTHAASYATSNADIVRVAPDGVLRAVGNGAASVTIEARGKKQTVRVSVAGTDVPHAFHFENDIVPILTKFGCNTAGCHGKAEGQNGFKLSVFGFDPEADRVALLKEGRGRRVFPGHPESSLLLQKAAGGVPHGGGVRIRRGSGEYRMLRDWIAAGAPAGDSDAPHVVALAVSPRERTMFMNSRQQLRAVATYSDGRTVDVTQHAKFQSNNDALASVDEFGVVTASDTPGEAAVMAAYMGAVDVYRALIPQPQSDDAPASPPVYNFVDQLVDAKLQKLNIVPSGLCTDAEFLRRASLDIIGTLPTAEETRAFLADSSKDKRSKLVDALLQRPEYADYWAMKWSDLLRVDRLQLGHKGAYSYYRWIRDSFAENKPLDEFARELVAAEGPLSTRPSGYLYKALKGAGERASTVSQVFLGVRIECAECHHHPFDRWSQTDYLGMQAFFTQVLFKQTPQGEMLISAGNSNPRHPRTGETVYAHPLGTRNPLESPEGNRRKLLADWMTSRDNPWFARNIVNRAVAHFFGRGLVEPVDDVRLTNPPSNPELLDVLTREFVNSGYDAHALIRMLTSSRTYQLSVEPNATNERDEQNYSRALFKRMDAEVLFDAVCQVTGATEKFDGMPAGIRAIQLWDSQSPHYFLALFGRPVRATACECERTSEPSVGQVLHVLNSPEIHAKLSHAGGRLTALNSKYAGDNAALIEELYLTFYNRYPTPEERQATVSYLAEHNQQDRMRAIEDIAWSMMNTVEFLFNH